MRKGILLAAAIGGAAYYWASRQPGGCTATWNRFTQGVRDIAAGQDAMAVAKRFLAGSDEEPAGMGVEALPWDSYVGAYPNRNREQIIL